MFPYFLLFIAAQGPVPDPGVAAGAGVGLGPRTGGPDPGIGLVPVIGPVPRENVPRIAPALVLNRKKGTTLGVSLEAVPEIGLEVVPRVLLRLGTGSLIPVLAASPKKGRPRRKSQPVLVTLGAPPPSARRRAPLLPARALLMMMQRCVPEVPHLLRKNMTSSLIIPQLFALWHCVPYM